MPRNDSEDERGQNSSEDERGLLVDRRSYLLAAGAVVGSAGLFAGRTSAATERHGIRFARTVDMVAEAGCDPTGREPCDAKIREAADDYTLLKFPAGEYKLTERNVILDKTNLGFVGEGDARFTVPEWYDDKVLVVDGGTGVLFEGIDIDQRAYGATPGLHLAVEDDLQLHDVEFLGQGEDPDSHPQDCANEQIEGCHGNEGVTDALYPMVRSPDGVGVIRNVVARNGGIMGSYTRIGVWIGVSTEGQIRFEDCEFSEFSGNGLYCSRTYGVVEVEGGRFRNNDISQVRIASPGSYVANALVEVDATDSGSPNPEDALNQRGVWFESRKYGGKNPEVRDCDISIVATPNSSGGVVTASTVEDFSVRDTRIGIDADGVRGVSGYASPSDGHSAALDGVSVTGSAVGGEAIRLKNHPDSAVTNCCINQTGTNRDGVRVDGSAGTVVRDSTIDVTGGQVIAEDDAITVVNVDDSGSCPVPDHAPSGGDGHFGNTLTIEGAPAAEYELSVNGKLEKSLAMSGTTIDPNDELSGSHAVGQVDGGRDSYEFTGEITRLVLRGGAILYYNGDRIDPAEYLQNTVTVESPTDAEYEITTSDGIVKSAVMGASDPNDVISGTTASGYVGEGGMDSYAYPGEIIGLDIDGEATVYRNGNEIDPDEFGAADSLTIEGAPGAGYELAVSGSLEKSSVLDATIDPNDEVSGTSAMGQVGGGGRDSYTFTGEITRLILWGGANLYYNGERTDPANYLPNTVTVESQSDAEYEITTSDGIAKSAAMGASDPNDVISGKTASGYVGEGGMDSYAYPGEITGLDIDGEATVYRNGERIDPDEFGTGNTLTIEGAPAAEYELSVNGELEKSLAMSGTTIDSNDELSGSHAEGQVDGGRDSYRFTGEITQLVLRGGAILYYNGDQIDPANYLQNTVTIQSQSHAEYEITTSDGIVKSAAMGASDPNDVISGTTASGQVGEGGMDSYAYPGEIVNLDIDGEATVYRNGSVLVDPENVSAKLDGLPSFGRLSL